MDEATDGNVTDYIGKIVRIKNGTPTWLHMDHLGSAQTGSSATGAISWREKYTPYGTTLTNPASNNDQAGFTGHIKDSATGLTYMQARYYDPLIGRFLSIDPVGFSVGKPQMFNRYSYSFNDPINNIDPDGRQVTSITNPIEDGEARDCDDAGCGDFGAARGTRTHGGHDILAEVDGDVVAPISGTIREIGAVYAEDDPDFEGIEITNNDTDQEVIVKIFYVDPSVSTGDTVEEGDTIGTVQDVAGEHGGGMGNHVHLQISQGGDLEDPEPLIDE